MFFSKFSKFLGVISSSLFFVSSFALCMNTADMSDMCSNCSRQRGDIFACDTNFLFKPTCVCSTECGTHYGSKYTPVPLKGRGTIVYTISLGECDDQLLSNIFKYYFKSKELKSKFAELLKGNKIKIEGTLESDFGQLQDEAKVNLLFDAALNYYHNQYGRNIIIDLIELGYTDWLDKIFDDCDRFILESNEIRVVNNNGNVCLQYDGEQKIPGSSHATFNEVNVSSINKLFDEGDEVHSFDRNSGKLSKFYICNLTEFLAKAGLRSNK